MDKVAALTAFARVVETHGFSAAARDLGVSRAQISKQVMQLEDALGVQLLNRTTRQVAATPMGQAFYERVRAILNDLAEAEAAVQDDMSDPQGELKINAPMSFGVLHLGPAIADFMLQHPRIRVQLVLDDRVIDPVADGFDITVRIGALATHGALIDHEIVEMKRVVCASPELLSGRERPQRPRDLANAPCLHYGNLPTGGLWRFAKDGKIEDVRVNGVLCSNNADVLKDAALRGLGFAKLPTFIAGPELRSGRLVPVLTDWSDSPIHLQLLYPPHRQLSLRTRLFVEFMYRRFADQPYWDTPD